MGALALGDRYLGLEAALRGADLVHAAEIGVPYSHGPALLKARLGFRLVLTVWETIPFGDAYRRFRGRRQRRETIPQVDLFLAATDRARRALLLEGAPTDRIEVAPPGIDTARFGDAGRARRAPGPVRRAPRLGEGPPGSAARARLAARAGHACAR